ncbi:MAG: dihydrolipoyl dehydrogenase [Chloroflexota bacterium]
MATQVIMPKMGMTQEEGTLLQWYKKEGERVEKGEPLFEVMTDKVSMVIEASATGILRAIKAQPNQVVPVTQVIAYIAAPDEEFEEIAEAAPSLKEAPVVQAPSTMPASMESEVARRAAPGRLRATPAARRLAKEHGLNLAEIEERGADDRIHIRQVEEALKERERLTAPTVAVSGREVPLSPLRRIIAQRMQQSAQEAPHIALTVEVDMTVAARARQEYSYTTFIVYAVARTLRQHPFVNATLRGDVVHLFDEVNVGVATATPDGLIVPTIKQADTKSLHDLDGEIKDLARRAREGRLTLDDVSGGTFTVSNLGMFGIDEFHAIINPPQSAILAVSSIVKRPVAVDDEIVVRPIMKMTLSADHRVLDGASAAEFMRDLKIGLEQPARFLVAVKSQMEQPAKLIAIQEKPRVIIIGSGPGGYVTALRSAKLGAEVTLVEKDLVGGTCLNVGCIPTKVLLESAKKLLELKKMSRYGIKVEDYSFSLSDAVRRKDTLLRGLRNGTERLFTNAGVRLVRGTARFLGPQAIEVTSDSGEREELRGTSIIVATGSAPSRLRALDSAWTSSEALAQTELPKSLLVVGGGAVGVEFASMYAAFGVEVTLVEFLPSILPNEDAEVSTRVAWFLEQEGIRVLTNTAVQRLEGGEVVIQGPDGESRLRAEKVLAAVGRVPYTQGLNLDGVGVATSERGAILVDDHLRTNVPSICAIGDVTGRNWLAHVASAEGEVAAALACGRSAEIRYDLIPRCVFSIPEIAAVGLTEEQARTQYKDVTIGRFAWTGLEKAIIEGEEGGFVKIVAAEGRMVGIHIVGAEATSLLMEGSMAMLLGASLEDVATVIHPHPTLSESIRKAAQAALS